MKNHIKPDWDLIIAGAGPAGLSAGIYAGRAGLKVLILEAEAPGGKVIKTAEVENYPGFTSIMGPELGMHFYNQAMAQNCEFMYSGIQEFQKNDALFEVTLMNGTVLKSYALIVATGTKENKIGIPGEDEYYGNGVSYCAVCDAAFYRDREVTVVGGGYAAVEEADYLTRFASKVTLIHRRQEFRVDDRTLQRARENQKIEFLLDHVVTRVNGESELVNPEKGITKKKVTSIEIKNVVTNEERVHETAALFPFIGAKPITNFIKQKEVLDENNYVVVNEKMETKIKGLYAAGDVRVTPLRQIVTATSDGSLAGQMAVEYIQHRDYE
jgi:thioredoxin reductase (NADPH)